MPRGKGVNMRKEIKMPSYEVALKVMAMSGYEMTGIAEWSKGDYIAFGHYNVEGDYIVALYI